MACAAILGGCATHNGVPLMGSGNTGDLATEDPCQTSKNAAMGAIVGGVLGAVGGILLDNASNDGKNRALAGAAGAIAGGSIGYSLGLSIDRRNCEVFRVAQAANMSPHIQTLSAVGNTSEKLGASVNLDADTNQFVSGSAELTPEARKAFEAIALQYAAMLDPSKYKPEDKSSVEAQRNSLRVFLVGHTDDTGSTQANAKLSEERARTVARIFQRQGIPEENIYYQGAGESFPIASNYTSEGRSKNRRVEIVDLKDKSSFDAYLISRSTNTSLLRPNEVVSPRVVSLPRIDAAHLPVNEAVASVNLPKRQAAAPLKGKEGQPVQMPKKVEVVTPQSTAEAKTSTKSAARTGPTRPHVVPSSDNHFVDFGGQPIEQLVSYDPGRLGQPESSFFIRTAQADIAPPLASCAVDRYRAASGVKSLKNGEEYKIRDFEPALYETSWHSMNNNHMVGLSRVGVLRSTGLASGNPEVFVFPNLGTDKKAKPVVNGKFPVNVYRGDKGVLYRVFVNEPQLTCVDVFFPANNPKAAQGNLVYGPSAEPLQKQTSFMPVK